MRFISQSGDTLRAMHIIINLCKRAKLDDYTTDTWVHPRPHIYLLKIQCEGAPSQTKNRKFDMGKSTAEEPKSCRPSLKIPFDAISSNIYVIRELMSRIPQGSREFSTSRHLYIAWSDYEICREE